VVAIQMRASDIGRIGITEFETIPRHALGYPSASEGGVVAQLGNSDDPVRRGSLARHD
jgi:hypothetical protein